MRKLAKQAKSRIHQTQIGPAKSGSPGENNLRRKHEGDNGDDSDGIETAYQYTASQGGRKNKGKSRVVIESVVPIQTRGAGNPAAALGPRVKLPGGIFQGAAAPSDAMNRSVPLRRAGGTQHSSRRANRTSQASSYYVYDIQSDDEQIEEDSLVENSPRQISKKRPRPVSDEDEETHLKPPYGGLLHGRAAQPGDRRPNTHDRKLFATSKAKSDVSTGCSNRSRVHSSIALIENLDCQTRDRIRRRRGLLLFFAEAQQSRTTGTSPNTQSKI